MKLQDLLNAQTGLSKLGSMDNLKGSIKRRVLKALREIDPILKDYETIINDYIKKHAADGTRIDPTTDPAGFAAFQVYNKDLTADQIAPAWEPIKYEYIEPLGMTLFDEENLFNACIITDPLDFEEPPEAPAAGEVETPRNSKK